MSRTPSKPKGTHDWNPKITNLPNGTVDKIKMLAIRRKAFIGDLLREWVLSGLENSRNLKKSKNEV